jgi:pyruvate dehydrogenase E1 component
MNDQDAASIAREVALENREWIESLDCVYENQGPARVLALLRLLQVRARQRGVTIHFSAHTPYLNTIPVSREIERRIKSLIRWNAMAMVVRANRRHAGIGGHISTFPSSATREESVSTAVVKKARKAMKINPGRLNPLFV